MTEAPFMYERWTLIELLATLGKWRISCFLNATTESHIRSVWIISSILLLLEMVLTYQVLLVLPNLTKSSIGWQFNKP